MRKTALFLGKITFSLGIVVILLFKTDVDNLLHTIINSNYWYFILSFLVSVIGLCVATLRWEILLKRFTANSLFVELFRFICISFFYNFFVPGGFAGDIVRGYKCRNHYLSRTQGIASVFVDRLIGLASFIVFGIIGMIFTYNLLQKTNILVFVWIVVGGSLFLLFLLFNRKIMSFFKTFSNLYPALYEKLKQFYDYIYYYKDYRGILINALIVSLLTTFVNILSFYLLSVSIGSEVPFIYFLFFIPVITIISYLPITYSGLGIREAGFVLLFVEVGMSPDQALGISLMYFGLLLILGIMGGIIYIITRPAILKMAES